MRVSKVVALAVAFAGVLLLSGCEQHGRGPAAISRDGSMLLVVFCDDFGASVQSVKGSVRPMQAGSDWVDVVNLPSESDLQVGEVISAASLPADLGGTWDSVDFETLGAVTILFGGANLDDPWQASFYAGGNHLEVPENGWLQTSGEQTADACPGGAAK